MKRKLKRRLAEVESRLEALETTRQVSFPPGEYSFDLDPEPSLDPRPPIRLGSEWWEEEGSSWNPRGYL